MAPPPGRGGVLRLVRYRLAALVLCGGFLGGAAGCGGGPDRTGDGVPPASEGAVHTPGTSAADLSAGDADSAAGPVTSLDALGAARDLQLKAALREIQRALLNFHVLNDRYPADQAEFESTPEVAAAAAELKALSKSLSYAQSGGTYTLKVTPRGGPPLTVTGGRPFLKPGASPSSPGA